MVILIAGLALFIVTHSLSIFAPAFRERLMAKWGQNKWRVIYSLVSIISLGLLIYGYGLARMDPYFVWQPPIATRHLALLLTLITFVLLAATYIPGTVLKSKIGHPMFAAVKVWALAHLFANGTLADILLFGGMLAWAVAGFAVHRRRDRSNGVVYASGTISRDFVAIVVGLVTWALFAVYLHTALIGVSPMP